MFSFNVPWWEKYDGLLFIISDLWVFLRENRALIVLSPNLGVSLTHPAEI